jgi:hypothetical protein
MDITFYYIVARIISTISILGFSNIVIYYVFKLMNNQIVYLIHVLLKMVFIANVPIVGLGCETPNCVIPWI